MILKEFVEETIIQVIDGIRRAQRADGTGELIGNPDLRNSDGIYPSHGNIIVTPRGLGTIINFDLAVSTSSAKSGEAQGTANIVVVDAQFNGKLDKRREEVNRITFSVPLQLPEAWNEK